MAEAPMTSRPARIQPERRFERRQKMVLRVGLLQAAGRTAFCLVKNISASGVQVKLYGRFEAGSDVALTVGDESPLQGRIKWVRAPLAGIEFNDALPPLSLLRISQKLSSSRRRSSPRANLEANVLVTVDGWTARGELRDISTSGARVRMRRTAASNTGVLLAIPGLPRLKAFVRWSDEDELGLSFLSPIPIEIIAGWVGDRQLTSI